MGFNSAFKGLNNTEVSNNSILGHIKNPLCCTVFIFTNCVQNVRLYTIILLWIMYNIITIIITYVYNRLMHGLWIIQNVCLLQSMNVTRVWVNIKWLAITQNTAIKLAACWSCCSRPNSSLPSFGFQVDSQYNSFANQKLFFRGCIC